ncbi:MAG: ArnT family glycosyltransferase [Terriglobales bacterium]
MEVRRVSMTTEEPESVEAPTGNVFFRSRYVAYALITLVLLLTFAIRFHLRNIPLERDEGEYAYAGQLMLQGVPPYKLAYNMKLPGTYAAYAVMMAVFGQTPAGVHLGLLVMNLATVLLVFLLGLRIGGRAVGVVAGASYALLSVSPSVLGFCGHASHFVVFMALVGILLLLEAINRQSSPLFLASGVFLGLAFMMKQPGLLFVLFGGLYLLLTERRVGMQWRTLLEKMGIFSFGAALPFVMTCLWLWRAGVFRTFWFWTFSYASQYVSNWGLGDGLQLLGTVFPQIMGAGKWIWGIAAIGAVLAARDQTLRRQLPFVFGFLLFSFLAVCPGLFFREHYFILMLPAVSILAGIAVSSSTKILRLRADRRTFQNAPTIVFLAALAWCFYAQKDFFLTDDPVAICRKIYGGNPFPEAVPISDYIRRHTAENANIAILGSEPEIYFYAHRHSATGYIYVYPMMEEQKYALQMQQQMISEIEAARPDSLVWVNVRASWLPHEHSEGLLLTWAQAYVREHYELTGVADIHKTRTDYRWGDEAKGYQPRSNSGVLIFKRKPA